MLTLLLTSSAQQQCPWTYEGQAKLEATFDMLVHYNLIFGSRYSSVISIEKLPLTANAEGPLELNINLILPGTKIFHCFANGKFNTNKREREEEKKGGGGGFW